MRLVLVIVLLLLVGCANWNWKQSVRSALESACNSVGNCAVSCGGRESDGWCQ